MTRLTDAFIRNVKPVEKTAYYKDTEIPQFGLRVTKAGAKAFTVLLGSGNRQTIGRYPVISLQEARGEAKRLLAAHTLNPSIKRRTDHSVAFRAYLAACHRKNRPYTVYEYERLIKSLNLPTYLDDLTPALIQREMGKFDDKPSAKRHAFNALRIYLNWCVSEQLLNLSPMHGMKVPANSPSRERVLSDQELGEIYQTALQGIDSYSRLIVFLILTGQRRGESSLLTWDMVNLEEQTITFTAALTKNKRVHVIPCPHFLTRIHSSHSPSDYCFAGRGGVALSGWSKPKRAFDQKHSVKNYTLHDIRRTFASRLAAHGVAIHVIEKLLNHVSGSLGGVAGIYNRYSYMDEMRDALTKHERYLDDLRQS